VYVVRRDKSRPPAFLEQSVGGRFKGRDPSVPIDRLASEWVEGTDIVYVGRAKNLRQRVNQLARFGRGEPIGHWGGRLLWQLADHRELEIAWLEDDAPDFLEVELVAEFVESHHQLPFANLVRPRGGKIYAR
jgi:hypothetical protein